TFAPLRALQSRRPRAGARRPRRAPQSPAAGRWSCVAALIATPASPTERAHARAVALLNRYGVVSRDVMSLEALRGGWSAIYPVLRAMEEAGKVRRGHFVEGYAGAQFAMAGAVDRLRAARAADCARGEGLHESEAGVVLAAADPAQPFGALLPWPKAAAESARPRRAAGARVLLIGGELAAWLDRAGRKLWTFPGRAEAAPRAFQIAVGLREIFRDRRRAALRIEEIDGAPALRFPHAGDFVRAGFRMGYRALELERHASPREA
ncbi:MAG: DEAD/DEAH box helicase, partial [Deltaproteobacteria bacterium]|nr:DEAD/DEAH box helicase [Deltaproteobacteria bacterium]